MAPDDSRPAGEVRREAAREWLAGHPDGLEEFAAVNQEEYGREREAHELPGDPADPQFDYDAFDYDRFVAQVIERLGLPGPDTYHGLDALYHETEGAIAGLKTELKRGHDGAVNHYHYTTHRLPFTVGDDAELAALALIREVVTGSHSETSTAVIASRTREIILPFLAKHHNPDPDCFCAEATLAVALASWAHHLVAHDVDFDALEVGTLARHDRHRHAEIAAADAAALRRLDTHPATSGDVRAVFDEAFEASAGTRDERGNAASAVTMAQFGIDRHDVLLAILNLALHHDEDEE
jgi:hypothetical protein